MEIVLALIDLLKSSLWPLVVVWLVWLLKDNLNSLFLKHKDTEVRLTLEKAEAKKSELDDLVNRVTENLRDTSSGELDVESISTELAKIPVITSEILGLKEELLGSLSSIAESGSNLNGEYTLFNNGVCRQVVTIRPGAIHKRTLVSFPAEMQDDKFTVTFVGGEVPVILRQTKQGMVLELPEPNKSEIKAIVYGFRAF